MSDRYQIAVCDDEARALSIVSASVRSVFETLGKTANIESFRSPADLLDRSTGKKFDLIFLDISMPGMDGIEVGKELLARQNPAKIIFVSSQTNRVFDTFEVQPFGFVQKSRFLEDLDAVIRRYESEQKAAGTEDPHLFYYRDSQGITAIDLTHVTFIECVQNTQLVHFDNSSSEQKIYSRMETLEGELTPRDFLRIHKGYLVNCKYIRHFEAKEVVISTGESLPVGRSHRKDAMAAYLGYVSRISENSIGHIFTQK